MPSLLLLAVVGLPTFYLINCWVSFQRNLRAAKASGFHYVCVPVYIFQRFWMITHRAWLPYIRKLPRSWWEGWIDYSYPEWTWAELYSPFKKMGTDTFLTVAPGGNMLWTCDANVITQMTTRRNDFPKPTKLYQSVDLYGKNVVSTEGNHWRQHRKITSPPFTEKNNHMVWSESLRTAQAMITSWIGKDGDKTQTVERVADDAMRLSLHVISQAGFGVKLLWPGVEDEDETPTMTEGAQSKIGNKGIKAGHTMSYTFAIHTLLHNILLVMLVPHWLLKNLPFQITRRAYDSFIEWGDYMNEMYAAKKGEFQSGADPSSTRMDLMGALVKGAGISPDAGNGHANGSAKGSKSSATTLTEREIIGNAFVFILAGHETAANSIHFSILNLALNIASQTRLQKDLDSIFQGRPISEWDYDRDLPGLFGGMAGAVMNEELRLVPPVINIPKCTTEQPQQLMVDGKRVTVPANTHISLISAAVQRNPKFWPHGPPSDLEHPMHSKSNLDNDLEEFKPERWLLDEKKDGSVAALPGDDEKSTETDDLGVNTAADTAATLFRPPKGAYIPFSEGYRSCLGRRFAQVEILAVLAVIFTQYSVELAVDDHATDEEIEKMDMAQRKVIWTKAADRAKWLMSDGMGTIITLQMRAGHVPLRFVKRGNERFAFA